MNAIFPSHISMLALVVAGIVSFAAGYAVRAFISGRRRRLWYRNRVY
jgi:hypothetical protein